MSSKTTENSSGESSKTSDSISIVKKVEEYFYNSDDFAQIFEDFAIKNAPKVDLSTDECKLEYTTMYNEFHKLYEDALSEYIESQGFSVKDFFKEIRNAFSQDENSDVAVFAKIMMATCDFDVFVMLMREQARRLQNKPMQNVSYEDFQDDNEGGKK
jgi:hypothetical protein